MLIGMHTPIPRYTQAAMINQSFHISDKSSHISLRLHTEIVYVVLTELERCGRKVHVQPHRVDWGLVSSFLLC